MMDKYNPDPEKYYRLSQPFETTEEAIKAVEAFFKELSALREKHRMANVHVTVLNSIKDQGDACGRSFLGNERNEVMMIAWALGESRAEQESWLRKLVAGKKP